jgi:hypothetical protein
MGEKKLNQTPRARQAEMHSMHRDYSPYAMAAKVSHVLIAA